MKSAGKDTLLGMFRKTTGVRAGGPATSGKSGTALEQAYRELLLENEVLLEGSHRLHDRLARAESGLSESPANKQLIRSLRDALADRSRQLREAQYVNQNWRRRYRKLQEDTRRLAESNAQRSIEIPQLKSDLAASRIEVAELSEQLMEARAELATLTDRNCKLQARIDPALSADRVVNIKPN